MSAKEDSQFKWRAILANFTDVKLLDGHHHKCPICGGQDRFRFDGDKTGNGSYYCNQCGAGTGINLLAKLKECSHADAWKLVESVLSTCDKEPPKKEVDRIARVQNVLQACHEIRKNGEVSTYLHSRGITDIPPGLMEAPAHHCATMMVGKFAIGKKLAGLHITFIQDGVKDTGTGSARKMFALKERGLHGSAIRLSALGSNTSIAVGEGIETTWRGAKRFGFETAWATGSAGLLEMVQIPPQVDTVLILGDNDSSFTGQAAAYILAKRLRNDKKSVIVEVYPEIDKDWADA